MRTTLDLDAELLAKAMEACGATTKTEVIELGLRELLVKRAYRDLADAFGAEPGIKVPPRRRPWERRGSR